MKCGKFLSSAAISLLLTIVVRGQTGTTVVRRAASINGKIEGSVHQVAAENVTLNGGAVVSGDLLMPGSPEVKLNGGASYSGTVDGQGAATPANHKVTLNGGATVRHVVLRTDPVPLAPVGAPAVPTGTRDVTLNNPGQSPGDFATIRNLTANGGAGVISVPPGGYGNFTANGSSRFRIGVAGATTPAEYAFQNLTLNGSSSVEVAGPVVVTLKNSLSTNGGFGSEGNPSWLKLRISGGGIALNGQGRIYGYVQAPSGTVTLNGGSLLAGGLIADRLVLNGGSVLRLVAVVETPPFVDADNDGMDDVWESANGLDSTVNDGALDRDGDGLTNLDEFRRGLKPNNADGDGDGLYDGDEIALGLDPKVPTPDAANPSTPAGLASSAVTTDSVALVWQASTDNIGVAGYIVYRNGEPIDTAQPIRGTAYVDRDLPDGEEFTYTVRAFDFAGNLSDESIEIEVATRPDDTDGDGVPNEWVEAHFGEDAFSPDADSDGDGLTNRQEFAGGTDPWDFFNGVLPVLERQFGGGAGPEGQLETVVRRPDGTPWAGAPVTFTVKSGGRRVAAQRGGPDYLNQLEVRADSAGVARVYLEPVQQ